MSFTNPLALLLLLVLPLVVWLGRPDHRPGSGRAWVALFIRCLIMVLLIMGLAGVQLVHSADELAVVYLVDASDSVSSAQRQAALDWVAQAIEALKTNDQAAVVLFGADALVDRPLSSLRELAAVTSVPEISLHTDISAAVRLGMALLPAGSARRLVILSDGVETIGDAAESARLAAASDVQIDVFPLGGLQAGAEVLLTAVVAPTRLTSGDRFDLVVTAESNSATTGRLRVLGDGDRVVYEASVALSRGVNNFTIPLLAGEQGFARYRVFLDDAQDGFYQNNTLSAYTEVVGPPRILLLASPPREDADGHPLPDESDQLALALLAAGVQVDRTDATGLPLDLAGLSEYASIVLVNVNAKHLGPRKMAALQTYVRDLGGGLVAVGGPDSYAPGGYYRTPLEETLPVEMQLKDQERRANLTMIFVIDKSGSMSDTSVGGIPKVELAKEAIIRSLGLLGPMDRAGVVAFDGSATWVVPIQEITDPDAMSDSVGTIRASGGTDIYAGLLAVAEVIPDDPANMKHVILLTDGGASEAGNPEITQEMHDEYGVTLSVVAIGQGFADWITKLPEIGEGRFHSAYDPDTIPEIFTQETTLATRAYIIEELFWPSQLQRHAILSGITAVPPLYGYIGVSAKPTARTILVTEQDDPLLAAWQYGLGKSVAWTSDATGRWAADWVTWAGFPRFWEQAVKWTITQERGSNAETEVRLDNNGQAVVTVETAGSEGEYLNNLAMDLRVVDPDGTPRVVEMEQVAPGRYQGSFRPESEGAYLIRVAGAGDEEQVAQTAGWVLGYSPEYTVTEPDHENLAYLANLTGGKVLLEPWESLSHNISAGRIRRPIWHWLALLALFLLPIDVAVRRLVIGREELAKLAARWRALWPGRKARPAPGSTRSEQVSRLFEAKQRAGETEPPPAEPSTSTFSAQVAEKPAPSTPAAAPTTERQPAEGSLASQLLKSKRNREEDA